MSFKDVYPRTKARAAYYMAGSTNKWIKAVWANQCSKEHTLTKKIAEEVMADVAVELGQMLSSEWVIYLLEKKRQITGKPHGRYYKQNCNKGCNKIKSKG